VTDVVVLTGPGTSPASLAGWLNKQDARRALTLPALGGTALTNLAKAFLAEGRHVELVTLAPELEDEVVRLEGPRLRILVAPFRPRARDRCLDGFRRERQSVRQLLAETSGRVVNAHWTYEFALGATRLPNRATVVTAHDAPFTILRYQRERWYRALRAAMAVAVRLQTPTLTAVSPYLASAWRRQMLYRSQIAVIPNVVPHVRNRSPGTQDAMRAPTILAVAEAGKLKNVRTLIRAMPEILECASKAELLLVGPGLIADSLLGKLARQLGVDESVHFMGFVEAAGLDTIYRRADLFVHPSLEESCPMSVAEAMSYGLPVVGGVRSGGVPWLLDEGRAGLLVDVKRPEAIARAVITLLEDSDLRLDLAAAGRMRVRSHLSPNEVANAYLEVYARADREAG
jgi:glycosyltransferase involved in cell wall biosynthesis